MHFFDSIHDSKLNSKLRTYKLVKNTYGIEPYILASNNKRFQQAIFRLRASSHRLGIETGRHTVPITPIISRICRYCKVNEIDDEFNFLLKCEYHTDDRHKMINSIHTIHHNFIMDTSHNSFISLLSSRDTSVLHALGKFVYLAFRKRDHYTQDSDNSNTSTQC